MLFLVFPVHLHLDLIILLSESRFSFVGGGGGHPPLIVYVFILFLGGEVAPL